MTGTCLGFFNGRAFALLLALTLSGLVRPVIVPALSLQIQADQTYVGMGRSVTITSLATLDNGQPATDYLLLPYVNGKRWGAHEYTDAQGGAVFHIPLPNPGTAEIRVEARPQPPPSAAEQWIWAPQFSANQTIYFTRTFTLDEVPTLARIWTAVDESADVYINGLFTRQFSGWGQASSMNIRTFLRTGVNTLTVKATNTGGPGGLLIHMEVETASGKQVIATEKGWSYFSTQPVNWPQLPGNVGSPVKTLGPAGSPPWVSNMVNWPSIPEHAALLAGYPLPVNATVSNAVQVQVENRTLQRIATDASHMIGVQWEPWFTSLAMDWSTAPAVPLTGFYNSENPSVMRQQAIWLMESGVDFLIADWTNHLWGVQHWADRPASAQSIVEATTAALDNLAAMRDEGLPVPRMVLLLGLINGVSTTVGAINEEMAWINQNYVLNARYHDLFLIEQGKPLIVIFNGDGPSYLVGKDPIDTSAFTIRWMSVFLNQSHLNTSGYWSWMDGTLNPPVTQNQGQNEAFTASVAFFSTNGWLYPGAYGRRGGWTYTELFKKALSYKPRFLQLHQYNEFTGTPDVMGQGANGDIFVDSYSVELSDDLEPVSLTTPAYRGNGGWGYFYLNLTRALVDLYRQATPATSVVVLATPARGQLVTDWQLPLTWSLAGRAASEFTARVNGKTVATHLQGTSANIDLHGFRNGPLKITLTAEGTSARYKLSYTQDSLPALVLASAFVEQDVELNIAGNDPSAAGDWMPYK